MRARVTGVSLLARPPPLRFLSLLCPSFLTMVEAAVRSSLSLATRGKQSKRPSVESGQPVCRAAAAVAVAPLHRRHPDQVCTCFARAHARAPFYYSLCEASLSFLPSVSLRTALCANCTEGAGMTLYLSFTVPSRRNA